MLYSVNSCSKINAGFNSYIFLDQELMNTQTLQTHVENNPFSGA